MLFNSFTFLVFFVLVTVGYFLLPHRFRWILLLIASYIFYMAWQPELIVLIVLITFTNYALSLRIYRAKKKRLKKRFLLISIGINFGLLFIFKYLVFMNESLRFLTTLLGGFFLEPEAAANLYPIGTLDIVLPMGISFYTFQAAAYTIDVYRGTIKPEKHYGIFSLFITFFPQLVAGPIERSENLLPQFYEKHSFSYERLLSGCKIMLLGFFKKIVIADRIAIGVNTIFNSPHSYSGLYFVVAAVLFTFQIYCDFSGYSDIAVGAARVLGFDLMENFKRPYLSKSIKEFWRRWHISLSTWFMDYVYIPLGGNRRGKAIQCRNIFITFLVSGLWHGSNWTYVLWGGMHGVYQVVGILTGNFRKKIKHKLHLDQNIVGSVLAVAITFGLVCFALIFFRANTVEDAFYISRHLFTGWRQWTTPQYLYEVITGLGLSLYEVKVILISLAVLVISEIVSGKQAVYDFMENRCGAIQVAYYALIAIIILTMGVFYDAGAFIYFQF